MSSPSVAVLVSGGLDSDVLVADLAERYGNVLPIYIRQGLAWETVELHWLRRFLNALNNPAIRPLRVLQVPMADVYGAHWSVRGSRVPGKRSPDKAVYLPGRNLILTVKTAVLCAQEKIPTIAVGSLDHNPFADATPAFFRRWAAALSSGLNAPLKIIAPYRRSSKEHVIRRGRAWPLELSFSCIQPKGRLHCGQCNKCAERRRAFRRAGVFDRTAYAG